MWFSDLSKSATHRAGTSIILGVLFLGLTGCYTKLQVMDSSPSATTNDHNQSPHVGEYVRPWGGACNVDGVILETSFCYSVITGRPWYFYLWDRSFPSQYRFSFRHNVSFFFSPSSYAFLSPYEYNRSFSASPTERSASSNVAAHRNRRSVARDPASSGVERRSQSTRTDEDRTQRRFDRSPRRDSSRSRALRRNHSDRRSARSEADRQNREDRIRRTTATPPAETAPTSRPTTVVENRLQQVDASQIERRTRRLTNSIARSMPQTDRISLTHPQTRAVLQTLVKEHQGGSLSPEQTAQFLTRLQRRSNSGVPPLQELSTSEQGTLLKAYDLPERTRDHLSDSEYDVPDYSGTDRSRSRSSTRGEAPLSSSRWDRTEQNDTEPVRSDSPRRSSSDSDSSDDESP